MKIRLNKFIAQSSEYSRRKADELIKEGKVKVNGKITQEMGILVDERDKILVENKPLLTQKKLYLIFHKPPGYITTKSDEKGRKTIYEFFPPHLQALKPAGRLDKDSSGLLFMTNDGLLIQKMTHPSKKVAKTYRVVVKGKITLKHLETLANGIEIEKGKIAYAISTLESATNEKSELEIVLYQGYNRQIRKMMEYINHPVISLKRTNHATLSLQGLKRGDYKFLSPKQLKELQNHLAKKD